MLVSLAHVHVKCIITAWTFTSCQSMRGDRSWLTEENEASRQTCSARFPACCPCEQPQRRNQSREGEAAAERWANSLTWAPRCCPAVTICWNVPADKLWEEPTRPWKDTFRCLVRERKRMCSSLSSKRENLFSHRDRGIAIHGLSLTQRLRSMLDLLEFSLNLLGDISSWKREGWGHADTFTCC